MKISLSLFVILVSSDCIAQDVIIKNDTLLKKEHATLSLDNGFAIPSFEVRCFLYNKWLLNISSQIISEE